MKIPNKLLVQSLYGKLHSSNLERKAWKRDTRYPRSLRSCTAEPGPEARLTSSTVPRTPGQSFTGCSVSAQRNQAPRAHYKNNSVSEQLFLCTLQHTRSGLRSNMHSLTHFQLQWQANLPNCFLEVILISSILHPVYTSSYRTHRACENPAFSMCCPTQAIRRSNSTTRAPLIPVQLGESNWKTCKGEECWKLNPALFKTLLQIKNSSYSWPCRCCSWVSARLKGGKCLRNSLLFLQRRWKVAFRSAGKTPPIRLEKRLPTFQQSTSGWLPACHLSLILL